MTVYPRPRPFFCTCFALPHLPDSVLAVTVWAALTLAIFCSPPRPSSAPAATRRSRSAQAPLEGPPSVCLPHQLPSSKLCPHHLVTFSPLVLAPWKVVGGSKDQLKVRAPHSSGQVPGPFWKAQHRPTGLYSPPHRTQGPGTGSGVSTPPPHARGCLQARNRAPQGILSPHGKGVLGHFLCTTRYNPRYAVPKSRKP